MRPVGSIYPCLGQVSVSLKHHQTEKSCSAIDSGNDNASSLFQTISGVTPTLLQSRLLSPVSRVPSTTGLSLSISLEKPRGRPYSPSGRGQSSRATSPSERQILVVCVPPFMHRMRPCAFASISTRRGQITMEGAKHLLTRSRSWHEYHLKLKSMGFGRRLFAPETIHDC